MDLSWIGYAFVLANAAVYTVFVTRRAEGTLGWTLASSLLFGPFVWLIWWSGRSRRAGARPDG